MTPPEIAAADPAGINDASGTDGSPLAAIVTALEEDIVFGRLHQSERLIEDDLLSRFQTKRHIIRQALVELERMGIVERIPNRGSRVRSYSPETIEQLYFVRELLETSAAKMMPMPIAAADLDEIKAVQAIHDKAVDEQDLHQVFRANIKFHRVLFGFCNNPFLATTINDFAFRTHGIRFYSLSDPADLARARNEHHEMIAALENAERDRLVDVCRRHLIPAKGRYLKMIRVPFS